MTPRPDDTGDPPGGGLIWIASYPKSGSTWMRLSIAAALNGGALPGFEVLRSHGLSAADRNRLEAVVDVNLSELLADELEALRVWATKAISDRARAPTLFKIHDQRRTRAGLDLVPETGTRAILHLVRDPRDVAISWAHHRGSDLDAAIASLAGLGNPEAPATGIGPQIPQWLGNWSDHCRSWMDADGPPRLTLRYEDRLADPVGTLRQALALARVDVPGDVVARSADATRFDRLQRLERETGFDEKPYRVATRPFFGVGRSGAWRDVLSRAQAARIEAEHGEMMARLGYL